MDFKLRQDSRVRLLEKTNARYLTRETLGESVEFIADGCFVHLCDADPSRCYYRCFRRADRRGQIVVLVKPQFEAGREHVGKGGIVRDADAQLASLEKVRAALTALGATKTDSIDSPILGAEGNREFLLYACF